MKYPSLILSALLFAGLAHAGTTTYSDGNFSITTTGSSVVVVNGRLVSGASAVQASGPAVAEDRQVSRYSGVRLHAPAEFHYEVAEKLMLRVFAPANILPLVKTEVKAGQLVVKLDGAVSLNQPLKIKASGPSLEALLLNGSGSINADGLSGPELHLRVSGSGDIFTSGKVQLVNVVISGSGDIDASKLQAQEAMVMLKGSGSAHVFSARSARVELLGSGDVIVLGQPPKRDVDKKGSGQVVFR